MITSCDIYSSCARIVISDRSGMGKSLYIQCLAEDLRRILQQPEVAHVTIPLHGPAVTPDTVLELFKDHYKRPTCCIYHIDIAPNVSGINNYTGKCVLLGGNTGLYL